MKRLLFILALALSAHGQILGPILSTSQAAAGGVVTKDAVSAVGHATSGATITNSITVGVGHSNTALVTACTTKSGGATFAANPGTAGATWSTFATDDGTTYVTTWMRGLAPSTGAQTVTINVTGSIVTEAWCVTWSLYNVNQTTPLANNINPHTATVTVTTASGDYAISMVTNGASQPTVSGCTSTIDAGDAALSDWYEATSCAASGATTSFIWSGLGGGDSFGIGVQHS